MRSGEYKLSFVLPVFERTRSVLLFGVGRDDLAEKLAALEMDVVREAPAGSRFDLIVAGGIPRGKEESGAYFAALSGALAESGSVAFLLSNRYGYTRIAGALRGKGARGDRERAAGAAPQSIGRYLGAIRAHGFETTGVYAAIPDVRNPSVIVPVEDTRPLNFLLSSFPDFSTTQAASVLRIARAAIRLGAHRRLMNWYIVVARKGCAGE